MKSKIYILTAILTLCVSCSTSTKRSDEFQQIIHLNNFDTIYYCHDLLGPIVDMEIDNSILITKHALDDFCFSLFNIEQKEMIGRWGEIGDGPEMYSQIGYSMTISNDSLIFQDIAKKEINHVSITDLYLKCSTNNHHLNVNKEKYLYNKDFRPSKIYPINSQWILVGSYSSGYIKMVNSKKQIVDSDITDYPFTCDEVQHIYRGSAFQTRIKVNEKQSKCVHIFNASDIFEIYEISDSTLHRIYINEFQHIPQIKSAGGQFRVDAQNSIAGFIDCTVSDNMICFLYATGDYLTTSSSKEILCYDWNGNKLRKYILPMNVDNICLADKHLYATIEEDNSIAIIRIKLTNL